VSSIAQASAPVELVVIDDGSTDPPTLEALQHLEDGGVRVVRQENQGQAAAAMTGVHATKAPYVMRFDSDDLLEIGATDALADALDAKPEAAAAWGDFQTFGLTTFRVWTGPALDPWLVTYTNVIPGSGTLFRRTALVDVGGWQLRTGYEDWDVLMALAERGHSGTHVAKLIFRYRRDGEGALAGWLADTERHFGVLRERHQALFAARRENRGRSAAPLPLKMAVAAIDALPLISRLTKIQLTELVTHLFWCGGLRGAAPMVAQGVRIRVGWLRSRRSTARQ
jgi:hypothetical protein